MRNGHDSVMANPHHSLIKALASLGDNDHSFKQDVSHLLFDEARILEEARKIRKDRGAIGVRTQPMDR